MAWPFVEKKPELWLVPVSIFLTSMGWWENYICANSPFPFIKALGKVKQKFEATRYFTYIFMSIWKCMVFVVSLLVILWYKEGEFGFALNSSGFDSHTITVQEVSRSNASISS